MSSKVESLEKAVSQLDPEEFRQFSIWFAEFEQSIWDRQLESDEKAGRLDFLREEAKREREAGTLRDI